MRTRIAWLYPSTGLLDGYLHTLAQSRGADLFVFRVVADPGADLAVASLGEPDRLHAIAHSARGVDPHVVAWACTAGSYIGGGENEVLQRNVLSSATGCPATTTSSALTWALRRTNTERVVALTPYTQPVGGAFCDHLRDQGFTVVAEAHAGHETDAAITAMTTSDIASLFATSHAAISPTTSSPRAGVSIVLPCTALRSELAVSQLEAMTGHQVVTANAATIDHALHLAAAASVPGERPVGKDEE